MQQPARHFAESIEAELYNQVDHRLVAVGQPFAELLVDQLEEHRLRGRGVQDLEVRIEPGFHGVGASIAPQNAWIVEIRAVSKSRSVRSQCWTCFSAALFRRSRHVLRIRSRISRAARSVKVMAVNWSRRRGPPGRCGSRQARKRSVSTNVLPQPAPAASATDTSRRRSLVLVAR